LEISASIWSYYKKIIKEFRHEKAYFVLTRDNKKLYVIRDIKMQ